MAQDPELELVPSQVLVPSLTGYGAQFNQQVYAAITGAPLERFAGLEQKVVGLEPQFARLFYNDRQASGARDQLESFVLTAELAQRAGAVINVTWQSGGVATPDKSMGRFADVLAYLATSRGVSNLRWVTIQNEPNSTKITPEQNAAMYRSLDRHLTAAGVRGQIRFMGGDLVADKQRVWFEFMAAHLADLLDAYSVHVYWDYRETDKFRQRLANVGAIVASLPESGRKPVFVSEYGVRGQPSSKHPDPGVYADGTPIGRTRIAAFQQVWFQILAARHGYLGASKWDCYFGRYDRGRQAYYAVGPWQDGWPLYPTYFALRLVTLTTEPGWQVVVVRRLRASARTKYLAAFAGSAGELSIIGLDSRGAMLNEVSPTRVSYVIAGLPPRTAFTLVIWNRTGDGRNQVVGEVSADGSGVAKVTAPLHAVFALTTKPVSGL